MPYDDAAIARELNAKYPDIRTAADARRERMQALNRLRHLLLQMGEAELAAMPDDELLCLYAEAMRA